MNLQKSVEERLSHLKNALREHICFLIDEGNHKALNNLVDNLSGGLNELGFTNEMWELSELLIDEFGYNKCPGCYWAIGEGERHFSCEAEEAKKAEEEYPDFSCQDCGSLDLEHCICGGDCCDDCGRRSCDGDCCDRCGSSPGTCQCYEGSPLASEDDEHRTGDFDDLIDLEEMEVND